MGRFNRPPQALRRGERGHKRMGKKGLQGEAFIPCYCRFQSELFVGFDSLN